MFTGILKEAVNEKRVGMLPQEVASLRKLGSEVLIESCAGDSSFASDSDYIAAGAVITPRSELLAGSDLVISVNAPCSDDPSLFREGQVLCSLLDPAVNREWIDTMRNRGVTLFGLDLIPRITRAQAMDVQSSMATIAGYRAVLTAACLLPRFFPMFMSAAGTIRPAKVLVLGAGVAGLQALAIARKLGAVVEVFDVRRASEEEVLSLGGRFISVAGAREDQSAGGYAVEQAEDYLVKQKELLAVKAAESDVIIATARIPGKRAPLLITAESVEKMKPGSVIIDLAASSGGNCELTADGKTITVHGVIIAGRSDLASEMPADASRMFGNNLLAFLKLLIGEGGRLTIDAGDEIVLNSMAVQDGKWVSPALIRMYEINPAEE